MTPAEWLAANDARAMLLHLRLTPWRPRKPRLFACAVTRRIGDGLQKERGRRALELAEQFAEGAVLKREMIAARSAASGLPRCAADPLAWRAAELVACNTPEVVTVLRDVFGNPFSSPDVDPSWLSWGDGRIREMAQAAYDDRLLPAGTLDNDRLGVLADALEEAGCSDEGMLRHCRDARVHVRGCWVLDLMLGKA